MNLTDADLAGAYLYKADLSHANIQGVNLAQANLTGAINGFIILFDRSFRPGDRIENNDLNTWGDVIESGMRTTRIQTRDNRMVIVPNPKIGKSQIVNYSYPDPHYRLQLDFLVSDEHDLEEIRAIMIDAVQGVGGILTDQSVNALVQEIGDGRCDSGCVGGSLLIRILAIFPIVSIRPSIMP